MLGWVAVVDGADTTDTTFEFKEAVTIGVEDDHQVVTNGGGGIIIREACKFEGLGDRRGLGDAGAFDDVRNTLWAPVMLVMSGAVAPMLVIVPNQNPFVASQVVASAVNSVMGLLMKICCMAYKLALSAASVANSFQQSCSGTFLAVGPHHDLFHEFLNFQGVDLSGDVFKELEVPCCSSHMKQCCFMLGIHLMGTSVSGTMFA